MASNVWGAILVAVAFFASVLPAQAAPAGCVDDAELEAVVGPQIRDGAFAISTARLGDRPMCSGVTTAQAIQQLRARYFPETAPVPLPHEEPARRQAPRGAPEPLALPGGRDITQFLYFEDANYCHSDALVRIFADADENGWAAIGPLGRVNFRRSRDREWTVLEGRVDAVWNGLRITSIVFSFQPRSDAISRQILFRDRPEAVGVVTQRLGFGLSRGERIVGGDNAMEMNISISSGPRGTMLECAH